MDKYFKFPLCLMQHIKDDKDKEGLLMLVAFGVMSFSEKMNFQKTSVANQIIYLYYRNPTALPKKLRRHIDDMIEDGRLLEDEDYHGFGGATFTPEQENEGMMTEFAANNGFLRQCVTLYKERQALSLLNLNPDLKPDFEAKYTEAVMFIQDFEARNGADAWTSVPTSLIFDVYNGKVHMNYLRLVAAVKSVLSKKNFNPTYKSVLLCRMFGCKKASILTDFFNVNPQLKGQHENLTRRRQWERLINKAEENGHFSYYCTGRQFFVSLTMTKEELHRVINIKREKRINA